MVDPVKKRKKISRRKPGDEKPVNNYFDDAAQNAIVKYQREPELVLRNKIQRLAGEVITVLVILIK